MSTFQDFLDHPIETLEKALHIRKEIAHLEKTLKELFGPLGNSPTIAESLVSQYKGRRIMSPEAKAKIAAAQRARWARSKAGQPASAEASRVVKRKKRKGGMSAEGRARIAAAQKARWAKVRKAKK